MGINQHKWYQFTTAIRAVKFSDDFATNDKLDERISWNDKHHKITSHTNVLLHRLKGKAVKITIPPPLQKHSFQS